MVSARVALFFAHFEIAATGRHGARVGVQAGGVGAPDTGL